MPNPLDKDKNPLKQLATAWALMIGLTCAVSVAGWFWHADTRKKNENINPAIFEAFREIEKSCASEEIQTVRCKEALDYGYNYCYQSADGACSAEEYYDHLYSFGFNLPPFYKPTAQQFLYR